MTAVQIDCPFCRPDPARLVEESVLIRVILDGFPVSPGHTLITTVRHVGNFFDITDEEFDGLKAGLWRARDRILKGNRPDGFNIGVNVGEAAGQTVQ